MIRLFFVLATFTSFCYSAYAQHSRISIGPEFHVIGSDLKWVYKNSPGISIRYDRFTKDIGYSQNVGWGISVSYAKFTPREDTLYYLYEFGQDVWYGTAVYDDYSILQILLGFKAETQIFENFYVTYGLELGYVYVWYYYHRWDEFFNTDGSAVESDGGLVPSVGLLYKVSDVINISPYFKYNLYFPLGSSDPSSASYNSDLGTFYSLYTTGLSIQISF